MISDFAGTFLHRCRLGPGPCLGQLRPRLQHFSQPGLLNMTQTRGKKRGKEPVPTDPEEDSGTGIQGKMLDRGQLKEYKLCAACEKPMTARGKWKDNWDSVKYCSERCRRAAKSQRKKGDGGSGPDS